MSHPKLLILFSARTGSDLLADLLCCHPSISCDGELAVSDEQYASGSYSMEQMVWIRSQQTARPVYGFKISLHQISLLRPIESRHRFISDFHSHGWRVIYLYRSDVVRQSMSYIKAARTGIFHIKGDEAPPVPGPVRLSLAAVLGAIYRFSYSRRREERMVSGMTHIRIDYEQDLRYSARHRLTIHHICDVLGLSRCEVSSRMTPTSHHDLDRDVRHGRLIYAAGRSFAWAIAPVAAVHEVINFNTEVMMSYLIRMYRRYADRYFDIERGLSGYVGRSRP